MPKFDRKKFWDGFRDKIDSTIEQEQVDGLEFLLGKMEADPFWKDVRHIAYALATTGHETAWSFQPVEEGYYLGKPSRVKAFQKTLRYYPYYGRGYVQLTWKSNYEKAGKVLKMDLVNKPELALDREGAYLTMTYGMHQGWFTGKKLSDYISDTGKDYKNARKIINGLDKASLIAGYANQFEQILREAKTNSAPTPPASKPLQQTDEPLVTSGDNPTVGQASDFSETPSTNIENIENAKIEAPKPAPQGGPVTVKTERTSIWTKIALGIAAITGMGINVGNFVNNKLNEMSGQHLAYALGGVALIALALWLYDRAQSRAQEKTMAKIDTASDPQKNTVELDR